MLETTLGTDVHTTLIMGSLIVFERDSYDDSLGSETYYYELAGTPKPAYLGTPIKITGTWIEGYVKESDLGVDLDKDTYTTGKAYWVFDTATGRLEIIAGAGDNYWR